jgi:hypothetical protein
MITISYRLLTNRTIFATYQGETFSYVVPAGTVFDLPPGVDPGPDVEVLRRRMQEREVA